MSIINKVRKYKKMEKKIRKIPLEESNNGEKTPQFDSKLSTLALESREFEGKCV